MAPDPIRKQMRRVVLPADKVVAFLTRTAPEEFPAAKLLEIHSDVRTGRVIFHLEVSTDEQSIDRPRPLDYEVNWSEVFGETTASDDRDSGVEQG